MKKRSGIIIILLAACSWIYGQNELDALRFSYHIPGGTARSTAMGGAFGALGADASVLSTNPAGMGVYQRSDFTFSPGFSLTNSQARFGEDSRSDFGYNFNLNNIAYIGNVYSSSGSEDYIGINLGFAYNRLMDFNQNIEINGRNNENSLTDWFAGRADGVMESDLYDADNFFSGLAYWTWLIDPINANSYVSTMDKRGQTQRELINRSGNIGEYAFSIAANLNHELYIGATLGIKSIRFNQYSSFHEKDDLGQITGFDSFTFDENLHVRGSGVNFKLGLLYRPLKWMRFGAAIHTPTFYNLTDSYESRISSNFTDPIYVNDTTPKYRFSENSKYGSFDYTLNTPFRAMVNVGFIVSPNILLSMDYEFVDYTRAKLRSDQYTFYAENSNIQNEFKPGHNIKLGGEYRYGPVSFRLGGAYFDSPYKSGNINEKSYTLVYSGGIGLRGPSMYFDISYSYLTNEQYYQLYSGYGIEEIPTAKINMNQSRVITTLGFLF